MYKCRVENKVLEDWQWVQIEDGIIHVIAPEAATEADRGHRIDGFKVGGLEVVRDAEDRWQVAPGSSPYVRDDTVVGVVIADLDGAEASMQERPEPHEQDDESHPDKAR